MRGLWLLLLGACCGGCNGNECTEKACSGEVMQVAIVDDDGEPVAARGEYEASTTSTDSLLLSFDCAAEQAGPGNPCVDGVLQVGPPWAQDFMLLVRFELPSGDFTEWQAVPLELTSDTDPDFNGAGCPCTSYEGSAEPVVVPLEARP